MHCSHLLIAFHEIQIIFFSNRSKVFCSKDSSCFATSNNSEAAPQLPFPPTKVTNTCNVVQEPKGTEHSDSTCFSRRSVKAAMQISIGY